MKLMFKVAAFASVLLSTAQAYAQDVCGVALTSRAFNTASSSTTETIAFANRGNVCKATYDSLTEARTAAGKAGFNLAYDGLSIGAKGSKSDSSGRTDISSTDFCQATAEDFKNAYAASYSQQIADAAVKAWTACVLANSNSLYYTYQTSADGQYFSGTIIKTVGVGTLLSNIIGISAIGPQAKGVSCDIGGRPVKPGQMDIPIIATSTAFGCQKKGDQGVAITVQTSGGSLPPIDMPSKVALAANRFKEIEAKLNALVPTAFAKAVLAFDGQCPAGWTEYASAQGRVIVGTNPTKDDGSTANGLPAYALAADYGKPNVILDVDNLPPHTHQYADIYWSESFGGATVTVPGNLGSGHSDNDNRGFEMQRTSQATGSAKPVDIQIPVRALRYCGRGS